MDLPRLGSTHPSASVVDQRTRPIRSAGLAAVILMAGTLSWPLVGASSAAAVASASATVAQSASPAGVARSEQRPKIRTQRWSSNADYLAGTRQKVLVDDGALRIADKPLGTVRHRDPYGKKPARTYDYSRWTSPWAETGFDATSLIPSWNVRAPKGTMVWIAVRTKSGNTTSSWDRVATWGINVSAVHRHSGGSQPDDLNRLLTDTLVSQGSSRINAWQLKITLLRPTGSARTPKVDSLGAVAANFTTRHKPTSLTTMKKTTELKVPRFSQMTHAGHYPQWDNGGEAWCSPTSTSMVLAHHRAGPGPKAYAWTGEADGQVDHAARFSYDYAYQGAGNWPFNTAYAGHYRMDAFVTRFLSLRDAEKFIRAGLPVVVSIAFSRGGLDGSPLTSTPGHLVVVTGFAEDGRVIVNDPSAATNSKVRKVYRRDQFEKAWLGGSGGVAYVIRPAAKKLPANTPRW